MAARRHGNRENPSITAKIKLYPGTNILLMVLLLLMKLGENISITYIYKVYKGNFYKFSLKSITGVLNVSILFLTHVSLSKKVYT